MIPRTTTIGSYPAFPRAEDIDYYQRIAQHGVLEDVTDPYLWSIEESIRDFTSAGIEVVSTGQTRGDLYSLFLDPKFVRGVVWEGAEAFVTESLGRSSSIRLADVNHAKSILPKHIELREPITDPYTLAKFAKINTSTYRDARELAQDINKKIIIPEIEDLQKSGAVSSIQLDSPSIAAESSSPDYILDLYEDIASVARLPLVLHACGDTTRAFPLLKKIPVHSLSLDFYHYPRLFEEASKRNYDQLIGVGCMDSQSVRVEPADEIKRVLEKARSKLGEDRISLVHPHCGQRSLNRETAYEKNVNLTLARDDLYFGEAEESRPHRLTPKEYDPNGYFLVSLKRDSKEIVVAYYAYSHSLIKRYRSKFAERILQSISEDTDKLRISRRHLAYLTFELGRAEASLQGLSQLYRQRLIE